MGDIQKLIDEVSVGQISANDIVSVLEDISNEYDSLESDRNNLEDEKSDLETKLNETEGALEYMTSEFEVTADEVATLQATIDEMNRN